MSKAKSIIFVCLGNICRSPIAQGVAEKYIKEKNLDIEIASAGTGDWHIGEAPCEHSIKVAAMNDVDDNCTDINMCESGVADADIHVKMSCEEVKSNYTFNVYSMSGTPFSWEVQYFGSEQNNSCGIDFTSITPITSGIRTIHGEVKEEKLGKFADILFSFAR